MSLILRVNPFSGWGHASRRTVTPPNSDLSQRDQCAGRLCGWGHSWKRFCSVGRSAASRGGLAGSDDALDRQSSVFRPLASPGGARRFPEGATQGGPQPALCGAVKWTGWHGRSLRRTGARGGRPRAAACPSTAGSMSPSAPPTDRSGCCRAPCAARRKHRRRAWHFPPSPVAPAPARGRRRDLPTITWERSSPEHATCLDSVAHAATPHRVKPL
jgi:hypothetical protein